MFIIELLEKKEDVSLSTTEIVIFGKHIDMDKNSSPSNYPFNIKRDLKVWFPLLMAVKKQNSLRFFSYSH